MASTSSELVASDLLEQATRFLVQQTPFYDNELLIDALKAMKKAELSLDAVEQFIHALATNIDAHDYLNRKNATSPIDFLEEIPPIYKSLKIFLDIAVTIKLASIPEEEWLLRVHKEAFEYWKDFYLSDYIRKYRRNLLLQTELDKDAEIFKFWNSCSLNLHRYPKDAYPENRSVFDRLDVDLILCNEHWSTRPIKKVLEDLGSTSWPGYVKVGEDMGIQYNPDTQKCYFLNEKASRGSFYDHEKRVLHHKLARDYQGRFPIRLCATNITNSHIVIARNSQGKIFMLYVTPASVRGIGWGPRAPEAYVMLGKTPKRPKIGLEQDSVDVIVIERRGHFNEKLLKNVLSRYHVSIENVSYHHAEFGDDQTKEIAREYKYTVCYLPESNKLLIVSNCGEVKFDHIEIENAFPQRLLSASPRPI